MRYHGSKELISIITYICQLSRGWECPLCSQTPCGICMRGLAKHDSCDTIESQKQLRATPDAMLDVEPLCRAKILRTF